MSIRKPLPVLVVLFSLLFVTSGLYGASRPAFKPDIRALGMGGAYCAYGDSWGAFLYNPALLANTGFHLAVPDLQFGFDKAATDVLKFARDNQERFEYFDTLSTAHKQDFLDDMAEFDDRWVTVYLGPSVGVTMNGFAFGVYDVARARFKLDRGIYEPRLFADVTTDIVFVGGHGLYLTDKLALGANGRIISRRNSGLVHIKASDMESSKEIVDKAIDRLEKAKTGWGLDVGALYNFNSKTTLGTSILDLMGTIDGGKTNIIMKLGIAHYLFPRLALTADLNDTFNRGGNHLLNKIYLGAN
ncbi:MAG: hypothetical protein ACE5JC_10385, partial [Candidatus Zixiibacteriota bacterium]